MAPLLYGAACAAFMAVLTLASPTTRSDEMSVELRMPEVQPKLHDTYLCVPMQAGKKASYITGFIPHANSSTAHHMLVYGCAVPFKKDQIWNCGEMASKNSDVEQGPVCSEGAKILYAWAMDATALELPKDVAFMVGGDSEINWVVLQVHYKDVHLFLPPYNQKDHSGVTMRVTEKPQPKRAGVYLLATDGEVAPNAVTYMETACSYEHSVTIHPFAYRTHAHDHGEVVSGYRVRNGEWTELGRKSPKLPEMFYNVTNAGMTILPGDIIAARCTMVNHENRTVAIGSTVHDEMCNFYLMYWVEGDEIMNDNYCVSPGPPSWYWSDVRALHTENIPSDASVVPGSDKVIEATGAKVTVENDLDQVKDEFIQLLEDFRSRVDAGGEGGEAEPKPREDKAEEKDGYYNYYQN